MSAHWSAAYVGIPYVEHGRGRAGADCWGLMRLVFADRGIALPSYPDVSPAELAEIAGLLRGEVAAGTWIEVEEPQAFDGAVFRRSRHDSHVGVLIDDRRMLHSDRLAGASRIERVDSGRWASVFVGYFRHKDLI